jgi:hypothetical protein
MRVRASLFLDRTHRVTLHVARRDARTNLIVFVVRS